MSQRLHIGPTEKTHYDCVITEVADCLSKLLNEWLMYHHGYFLSPWKIRVIDFPLFKEVLPKMEMVLEALDVEFPHPDKMTIYFVDEEFIPKDLDDFRQEVERRAIN